MTTDLTCEQLLLGWSPSNLLGVSGFGPVAASPGWELSSRDRFAGLGDAGRYLPEQGTARGSTPPTCLEYRPDGTGALLLAKVYSTASPRGGQYQVHAIRAPRGVSGWDLWASSRSGVLITEELTVYDTRLATVHVTPTAPPSPGLDPDDAPTLARLLQALDEGRPYLISTRDAAAGELALQRLLAYLPVGIAAEIAVSTFVADTARWASGIGLVIPPFSGEWPEPDLDLDAGRAVAGPAVHSELAALLTLDGPAATPVRTLADLRSWLTLARADLTAIGGEALRRAIDGPLFGEFLARLCSHPRCGAALLRVLADPGTEDAFADRLRSDGPESADLVATLIGRVGSADAGAAARGSLQTWLLTSVGADQFAAYVAAPLAVQARAEGVEIHSDELAAALARSRTPEDLAWFDFAVGTQRWSAVTEVELIAYLLQDKPLSSATWTLLRRSPERAAAFLDDQLTSGTLREATLGHALARWPQESLTDLIAVLTRTKQVPKEWAVRVLGQHPAPVIRAVLETSWPDLAAHLGIPDAVAEQLTLTRKPWWRFGDA